MTRRAAKLDQLQRRVTTALRSVVGIAQTVESAPGEHWESDRRRVVRAAGARALPDIRRAIDDFEAGVQS